MIGVGFVVLVDGHCVYCGGGYVGKGESGLDFRNAAQGGYADLSMESWILREGLK